MDTAQVPLTITDEDLVRTVGTFYIVKDLAEMYPWDDERGCCFFCGVPHYNKKLEAVGHYEYCTHRRAKEWMEEVSKRNGR